MLLNTLNSESGTHLWSPYCINITYHTRLATVTYWGPPWGGLHFPFPKEETKENKSNIKNECFLVFWLNSAVVYCSGFLYWSPSDMLLLRRLSSSEWNIVTEKAVVLAGSLHLTDDTHGALFPGASGVSCSKTCVDFILKASAGCISGAWHCCHWRGHWEGARAPSGSTDPTRSGAGHSLTLLPLKGHPDSLLLIIWGFCCVVCMSLLFLIPFFNLVFSLFLLYQTISM